MTAHTHDPAVSPRDAGERWMTGDLYPNTAGESLGQVGERLHRDLLDVQGDGMIRPGLRFDVAADESGPVGVLRISISGLPRSGDPSHSATSEAVHVAFELASHYNRVDLAHPERARFIQCITTSTDDGAPCAAWVTTMLGDPDPHTQPTPSVHCMATVDEPVPVG